MSRCTWATVLAANLIMIINFGTNLITVINFGNRLSPPKIGGAGGFSQLRWYEESQVSQACSLPSGLSFAQPVSPRAGEKNLTLSPPEVWRAGDVSARRWYEIPRHANASTSTTTTQRWQDFALGKIVKVGTTNYVKVADDQWLAMENPLCNDPVLLYPGSSKSFDYTGGEQTYTTYANCQYKLEVWGASGGWAYDSTRSSGAGGYGGYAEGVVKLASDTEISVVIGGEGKSNCNTSSCVGGYNGGSESSKWAGGSSLYTGGGGGATHMALDTGVLSDLSAHATDGRVLIVAGGGGGGNYYNRISLRNSTGGSGGGAVGVAGPGQSSNTPGSQSGGGSFGLGLTVYHSDSTGGAGGGYYGGRSHAVHTSGGGGSGYIGSSSLVSAAGVTKHMTCYDCAESSDANTRTISNNCATATATPDCSKIGNGYARITRLN